MARDRLLRIPVIYTFNERITSQVFVWEELVHVHSSIKVKTIEHIP